VLATVLSWVKSLNTECVERSLARSTFDLTEIVAGKPISIYLCIPPDKLTSHKSLLRLWVAALMTTILRREERPEKGTLFLLDECAQLGNMPLLEQAVTLLRGYGLQVWTFWQDVEQVKACYPTGHMTLINNSAVLQTFGVGTRLLAKQLSDVLDCPAHDLLGMKPQEEVICRQDGGTVRCRRPDYLTDPAFSGMWDPNPFFGRSAT
jgi:type IV secretion system protein VirD4